MGTSIVAVVGVSLLLASCSTQGEVRASKLSTAAAVAVSRVAPEDLSRDVVLTAEFKPYQEIDVMAKVAGYIKQIRVDVGDRVSVGELLAVLEVPEMQDDLRRASASVERGNAEVNRARDELQRAETTYELAHLSFQRLSAVASQKPGLIAQQEIDDARSKDLTSEAQVAAARSQLASASQQVEVVKADVGKVKTLMDYTRVNAPFAGVITKRYADLGSMIQAGTASQTQAMPVVRLSDNRLLRLILPVPESAVPAVRIGQRVEVRVPSLNRTLDGRVARFANSLSLATRTMDTEVDVQNPSLDLLPGMFAEVTLTLARRNRVLAVPVSAVDVSRGSERKAIVWVVTPNRLLEKRAISLGLETADYVEVRSGLNEGDQVVVGARAGLQTGEAVNPQITVLDTAAGSEVH